MDLVALTRIALRRWKILVPMLVLSAGIGWLAATAVAPTYQVDGAVRVSYPFATSSEVGTLIQSNPFYDTESTAVVLGRVGSSVDLADAVAAAGGTSMYVIDGSTGRSILTITVTGPDEQEALKTYGVVVRQLSDRLEQLQADKKIPEPYRITADDVVQPRNAVISNSSRTKVLIASLALGAILSIAVSLLADHRMRRRDVVAVDAIGGFDEDLSADDAPAADADPGGPPAPLPRAPKSVEVATVALMSTSVRAEPATTGSQIGPPADPEYGVDTPDPRRVSASVAPLPSLGNGALGHRGSNGVRSRGATLIDVEAPNGERRSPRPRPRPRPRPTLEEPPDREQ